MFIRALLPREPLPRFLTLCVCLLFPAGCRIESTPLQYIDRQTSTAELAASTEAELAQRLEQLSSAIATGDSEAVETLLASTPDTRIATDLPDPSLAVSPGDIILNFFQGRQVLTGNIDVSTGPQNNLAWFVAEYRSIGAEPTEGSDHVVSGVYRRQAGVWRLVQMHLSSLSEVDPEATADDQADAVVP